MIRSTADCISVINALLQTTQEISTGADANYTPSYLGDGDCRYTYAHAPGFSFDYDSNSGTVTTNF